MWKYLFGIILGIALFITVSKLLGLAVLIGIGYIFTIKNNFLGDIDIIYSKLNEGIVYCKDFNGSYQKNGAAFQEMNNLIYKFRMEKKCKLISLYYDNPNTCRKEKQRATIGIYKEKENEEDLCIDQEMEKYILENGFKKSIIKTTKAIVGNWKYDMSSGMISYLVGVKKFYDKYMKLLSEEAFQKKTGLSDKNPPKVSVEVFTDKDKVDFIIPYGEVDSLMIHDSFNM